jgi:hypothetical protein
MSRPWAASRWYLVWIVSSHFSFFILSNCFPFFVRYFIVASSWNLNGWLQWQSLRSSLEKKNQNKDNWKNFQMKNLFGINLQQTG